MQNDLVEVEPGRVVVSRDGRRWLDVFEHAGELYRADRWTERGLEARRLTYGEALVFGAS